MKTDVTGYLAHVGARGHGRRNATLWAAVRALATGDHLHIVSPEGTWCSGTCKALLKPMPADADFRRGLADLIRAIEGRPS